MCCEQLEQRMLLAATDLIINGTSGNDFIKLSQSNNVLTLIKNGVTTTYNSRLGYTKIIINGLAGDDAIKIENSVARAVQIFGGTGSDMLQGGGGADLVCGASSVGANEWAKDVVMGGGGNDSLYAGLRGENEIWGGPGNDQLHAYGGSDVLIGGDGDDVLDAGAGSQTLRGGSGNDLLMCGAGNDEARGEAGNDSIYGSGGSDTIDGADGRDWIEGGDGDDLLKGSADNDVLLGGVGNDQLYGGTGVDNMMGGDGDDTLVAVGGSHSDSCAGNIGNDSIWADSESTEKTDASTYEKETQRLHRVSSFFNSSTRELSGPILKDPTTKASEAKLNFKDHRLFSEAGPKLTDINQGILGDCWFVATLASVARTKPQFIRNMVVDLGDGTFAVQLFSGPTSQRMFVRVDADLWVNEENQPIFARFGTNGCLWAPIVEKAAALLYGGTYGVLDNDRPEHAMTALGISHKGLGLPMMILLKSQLDGGGALVASSKGSDKHVMWGGQIVSNHAYAVTAVDVKKNTVTIYNPWGTDTGGGTHDWYDASGNDGFITITGKEFFSYFARVTVGFS
jgi:Ca2+-binding RTX toxin-like protein